MHLLSLKNIPEQMTDKCRIKENNTLSLFCELSHDFYFVIECDEDKNAYPPKEVNNLFLTLAILR